MNSFKFSENRLADKDKFYSSLKDKCINDKDNFYAINVWNLFEIKFVHKILMIRSLSLFKQSWIKVPIH